MRPEQKSVRLLGVTRSKGKMYEYGLPEKQHININENPTRLFHISIALLGELAAAINRGEESPFSESELKKNLIFSAYFLMPISSQNSTVHMMHMYFFLVLLPIIYVTFPEVLLY